MIIYKSGPRHNNVLYFYRLAKDHTEQIPLHSKFAYREAVNRLEQICGQQEDTGLKQQANEILNQIVEAVQR